MKNLLFVFFVFAGMITFFTHAMIFAAQVNATVFWLAVSLILAAMVAIGCWDLGDQLTNRLGWIFMVIIAAFCILVSLPKIEGAGSLLKLVFLLAYGAVGVIGFLREKESAHGHAH